MDNVAVLFVCLGNICRSPTAQGVFQKIVDETGLSEKILVDSAGTSGWHIGEPPDQRTVNCARQYAVNLSQLRGRKTASSDFQQFDYILAMDESNLADLQSLRPENYRGHLGLFLDFSDQKHYTEVPDPYYGDGDGFELVYRLVDDAGRGLLQHIQKNF